MELLKILAAETLERLNAGNLIRAIEDYTSVKMVTARQDKRGQW